MELIAAAKCESQVGWDNFTEMCHSGLLNNDPAATLNSENC